MSEAVDQVEAVNAEVEAQMDMDWDNIEETAPSMLEENGKITDEEPVKEDSVEASKDDDSASKEVESKSEDDNQAAASKEASEGDAPEANKEVVDINDLPDNTVIKAKVDGELQEISLKDFKNGISGQKAIDKRFSEYDKSEKALKAEISQVNDFINDLGTKMKTSSVMEGFAEVGKLVGLAPHQLKAQLIKELLPEIERMNGMTQEEVNLEYNKNETSYTKSQLETQQKEMQEKQATMDLDMQVSSVKQTHSIDNVEWDNAVSHLDSTIPQNEPITPNLVAEYVQFSRAGNLAETVINSIDSGLMEKGDLYNTLQNTIIDNPDFTQDDLKDIVSQSLNLSVETEVKDAIEKSSKKSTKKEEPKDGPSVLVDYDGNEVLDWDDVI